MSYRFRRGSMIHTIRSRRTFVRSWRIFVPSTTCAVSWTAACSQRVLNSDLYHVYGLRALYNVFSFYTALVLHLRRTRRRAGCARFSYWLCQGGYSPGVLRLWVPYQLLRSWWVFIGLNIRMDDDAHRCAMWRILSISTLHTHIRVHISH